MARIIIVDDKEPNGLDTVRELRAAGHTAELVSEDDWQDAANRIAGYLGQDKWDILVLDINFPRDQFGGVWLYNSLVAQGLHERWDHTILYTLYYGSDIPAATEGESLILRTFIDTARIPFDCVLSNQMGGRRLLLNKVAQLLAGGPPAICGGCWRPR